MNLKHWTLLFWFRMILLGVMIAVMLVGWWIFFWSLITGRPL